MPARFLFLHVPLRISPRMSWPPSNSTLQFRLWGGFGEALRRLGEAWEASGASKLILGLPLGGFGRLWETLGEPLGRLWEALGSFGRRWGSLWGVFGRLWGSFGRLWGFPPPVAEQQKQLYTKMLGVRKLPINQLCWPNVTKD